MKFRLIPYEISRTQAWVIAIRGNPDAVTQEQTLVYDQSRVLVAGIDLPYLESEIDDIVYAQYQDTLVLTHPNHPPRRIFWDFALNYIYTEEFDFSPAPTLNENVDQSIFFTTSTPPGNSVATITTTTDLFEAEDVGRAFYLRVIPEQLHDRWESGRPYVDGDFVWSPSNVRAGQINVYEAVTTATSGNLEPGHDASDYNDAADGTGVRWRFLHSQDCYGTITSVTDANTAQITADSPTLVWPITLSVDATPTQASSTYTFSFGSFGQNVGYPTACEFHQGRLVLAGTPNQPQTVWASAVERFRDFRKGTLDTDPWNFTITGPYRNAIQNLTSTRRLICGTQSGFFVVRGSGEGLFITPTNVAIDRDNFGNSATQNLANVNNRLLYIEDSKTSVRELRYDFDSEGYISTDRSIVNQERLSDQVKQLTTIDEPISSTWMVRTDGQLIGFTYDPTLNVTAWHHHIIAGGTVESICKLPTPMGDRDVIFAIVYYEGTPELHVVDLAGPVFMDRYVNAEFTSEGSGVLDFPVGTTVSVVQGDNYFGDFEVQPDNTITVTGVEDGFAYVGLKFVSDWLSLPYGLNTQSGSPGGKSRRVHDCILRLLNTAEGLKFGAENNLRPVKFRRTSAPLDNSPSLFTGDTPPQTVGQGYDEQGVVRIQTDVPLSAEVLAIYPQMYTNDAR